MNLHLGVGILQMWYDSLKYYFSRMDKCQRNYLSVFRTAPSCTVASNKTVSDVIQTSSCIHFFPRMKQEIFVSDSIFITPLVLASSSYPTIFLKLFRYVNLKPCSINVYVPHWLIYPNTNGVLLSYFHWNQVKSSTR